MKRLLIAIVLLLASSFALAAVNLNTATREELDALPGIGPVKAQAILDYRAANGPFKTPEDVMKVKGIKEGEFAKIKDQISVSGRTTPAASPASAASKPEPRSTATTGAAPAASGPAAAAAKDTTKATAASDAAAAREKAKEDKAAKAAEAKAARAKAKEEKAAKAAEAKAAKEKAAADKSAAKKASSDKSASTAKSTDKSADKTAAPASK